MRVDNKFQLTEKGCVPFDITQDEYNYLVSMIKGKRREDVKNSIKGLISILGIEIARGEILDILSECDISPDDNEYEY